MKNNTERRQNEEIAYLLAKTAELEESGGATGPAGPQGPAGADGADGADGAAGAPGADGADGADGSVWRDGTGAPADALGVDGDYYLDTANGNVYVKSGGAYDPAGNIKGATGDTGPAGADGASFDIPRLSFSDFYSRQGTGNDPFIGSNFSLGGNSSQNVASETGHGLWTDGIGWVILRSSSTNVNSGYRWDTSHPQMLAVPGQQFRCIFNTMDLDTDVIAQFGFSNNNLQSDVASETHVAAWKMTGGVLQGIVRKSNSHMSTTNLDVALNLSASTTYMVEVTLLSTSSAEFKLYGKPTNTFRDFGTLLFSQTLTLDNGEAWGEGVSFRAGMAAINTNASPTQKRLIALDYMSIGA